MKAGRRTETRCVCPFNQTTSTQLGKAKRNAVCVSIQPARPMMSRGVAAPFSHLISY